MKDVFKEDELNYMKLQLETKELEIEALNTEIQLLKMRAKEKQKQIVLYEHLKVKAHNLCTVLKEERNGNKGKGAMPDQIKAELDQLETILEELSGFGSTPRGQAVASPRKKEVIKPDEVKVRRQIKRYFVVSQC